MELALCLSFMIAGQSMLYQIYKKNPKKSNQNKQQKPQQLSRDKCLK